MQLKRLIVIMGSRGQTWSRSAVSTVLNSKFKIMNWFLQNHIRLIKLNSRGASVMTEHYGILSLREHCHNKQFVSGWLLYGDTLDMTQNENTWMPCACCSWKIVAGASYSLHCGGVTTVQNAPQWLIQAAFLSFLISNFSQQHEFWGFL